MHQAAAQYANVTAGSPPSEDSKVARAMNCLQSEIYGLSVAVETVCGRVAIVSSPYPAPPGGNDDRAVAPATSLMVKKIDDQANRVRQLANQLNCAVEALEI